MKNKLSGENGKERISFWILCILGFTVGIMTVNWINQQLDMQIYGLGIHFIDYTDTENITATLDYKELIKKTVCYLLVSISGLSFLGIWVIILVLLWNSFLMGSLMSMFLLEYGVMGIVLCMGCWFPHYIFYLVSYNRVYVQVLQMTEHLWNQKVLYRSHYKKYFIEMLLSFLVFFMGIFMECYVNFYVMRLILNMF